jgi:hypothetical protein
METKMKLNPLDSRQRALYGYIQQYLPYLCEDPQELATLILLKATHADEVYRECISAGGNAYEANEAANEALYADLHFSPITYIQEVALNNGHELDDEAALCIYKQAKPVFDRHTLGDGFEGSDREEALIEELAPFITKYVS